MPSSPLCEKDLHRAKRHEKSRARLLFVGIVAVCAAFLWFIRQPARLTAEERQLVGTWAFPVTRAPGVNVQQIIELRANRTIITRSRSLHNGMTNAGGLGQWRLENKTLIWDIGPPDYSTRWRALMDGHPRRFEGRLHYLGMEDNNILVKSTGGETVALSKYLPGQ